MGAAAVAARHVSGDQGAALLRAAEAAFVSGADRGILVAAATTLIGSVIVARALRNSRSDSSELAGAPAAA